MTPSVRVACVALFCLFAAACSTPGAVEPSELPPPGEPDGLLGMSATSLRLAFGPPAFVRKDGADEMWRYDTTTCKAFFFLYPQGAQMQVRHVETLPRGQDKAADPDCLNALRAQASPPVS